MYLWTILKQKDDQLIRKTYNAQQLKTTKGDWYEMVQGEKRKFSINLTDQEISQISRYKFKKIVDKNVGSYAFESLKVKASTHSKSLDILAGLETQLIGKRKAHPSSKRSDRLVTKNVPNERKYQLVSTIIK